MIKFRCLSVNETDDDYAKEFEADTPEKAACLFCEQHDASAVEYPDEQEVVVISPDGSRATLTVLAASVREYWVPRKRRAI